MTPSLRSTLGHLHKALAILTGSRESSCRYGPRLRKIRTYASPRSELDVKGIGPFSF